MQSPSIERGMQSLVFNHGVVRLGGQKPVNHGWSRSVFIECARIFSAPASLVRPHPLFDQCCPIA
ncbi:MAG: hypothetical protein AAGI69_05270 [Cyanobacteria bacterium P01_H01_bin.21]